MVPDVGVVPLGYDTVQLIWDGEFLTKAYDLRVGGLSALRRGT